MRFYLDENLPQQIAIQGRRRGLDIVSAHDAVVEGLDDLGQLLLAVRQQRCFITADRGDFSRAVAAAAAAGIQHAGVLYLPRPVRRAEVGRVVDALVQLAAEYPEGMPAGMEDYLRWR